jgi:hypothetical protein
MSTDITRPEPLVPAGVSMGNNDWFPLHFRRMRKSRWWRVSSDLARSRSVDLWGFAYEETPAGSLPDDDAELADFAGFGRDVRAWLELKDEVMAAWVLCSDGRWYHPTLCEVILEAWEKGSVKRKSEAQRKAEYRARVRAKAGDVPVDKSPNVPSEGGVSHGTVPKNPGTVPVEERKGQDRTGDVAPDGAVAAEAPTLPLELTGEPAKDQVDQLVDAWNAMVERVNQFQPPDMGLATVKKIDEGRRRKAQLRIQDYGFDGMLAAVETVGQSTFLRGHENQRGSKWRADFDFLMQPKSIRKVVDLVWPRNIDPEQEKTDGPGTGADWRQVEHSGRVRDSWESARAGLDEG